MKRRYLIVAGTEKAGTTSVYHFLNAHPNIIGSTRKETDFFRQPRPHCLADYLALFPSAAKNELLMEASPGYLADSAVVSKAIATLLPNALLVFILRNPIDRLLSSFAFSKTRFHISNSMTFDDYINLCMRYERKEISPASTGLKEWHLRVPDSGRYALHLKDFYQQFSNEQILVLTTDYLQRDPANFTKQIASWAGLDGDYYCNFSFVNANVTFRPRIAWLHKCGLYLNDRLEPFFNTHPKIKQRLLAFYKITNAATTEKPTLSQETRRKLLDYYSNDINSLMSMVGDSVADAEFWLEKYHGL